MGSEVAPPPLPSGPPGPHGECVQGVYGGHRHLRRVSARCCRLCPFPFYCPPPSSPPPFSPSGTRGAWPCGCPSSPGTGKWRNPGPGADGPGEGARGRRGGGGGRGGGSGGRAREGALGAADVAAPQTLPRDFRPPAAGSGAGAGGRREHGVRAGAGAALSGSRRPSRVTCLFCGPRCFHLACPVLSEPRVPPAVPA